MYMYSVDLTEKKKKKTPVPNLHMLKKLKKYVCRYSLTVVYSKHLCKGLNYLN